MKHNEHEVEDFKRYAEEIGVDEYEIVYPGVKSIAQGHEFLTDDDRYWIYSGYTAPDITKHDEITLPVPVPETLPTEMTAP